MNGINPNYQQYMMQNTGVEKSQLQGTIDKAKQSVAGNVESNSAAQVISGTASKQGMSQAIKFLPIALLADKFIDKSMGGAEGQGLLYKAAGIGDKISNLFKLDRLHFKENSKKITDFIKNNRFTKYFTSEYAAVPKTSMAQRRVMSEEFSNKLLSQFADIKYMDEVKDLILNEASGLSAASKSLLSSVGPTRAPLTLEFVTDTLVKSLDELAPKLTDKSDLRLIRNLNNQIIDKISKGRSLTGKDIASSIQSVFTKLAERHPDILVNNPELPETFKVLTSLNINNAGMQATKEQILNCADDLIKNNINITEATNKLKAAEMKIGKTGLGKMFAKGTLKTKDVITYGGGILGLIFTISAISNTIKETKEAPKGEKLSTFMHVLSEQYLGLLLFSPSINMMYKICGNKYRGMTPAARNALKELIQKVNSNPNLTKEGLKIAKIQKDLLLRGVDKTKVADLAGKSLKEVQKLAVSLKKEGAKLKFWEKPLKALGRVLSAGLDKMKIPKFINIGKKSFKLPRPTVKGFAGGFARFAIIMFVLQPLLQKPITKLCHKIFGKPKTYLEKQNNTNKENVQNPQSADTQNLAVKNPSVKDTGETNLVKIWTQQPEGNDTPLTTKSESEPLNANNSLNTLPQPATVAEEPLPAFKLFNKDKQNKNGKEERYIPSINVEIKNDVDAELQKEINNQYKSNLKFIKTMNKKLN